MRKTILISMILLHAISVSGWAGGEIVVWGNDEYGQVSNAPGGSNWVFVDGGLFHCVARDENNNVVAWGSNEYGQCNTPSKAISISAGDDFIVWINEDGTLGGCGYDPTGLIFDFPEDNQNARVACGAFHVLVLKKDGSVDSRGVDTAGQVSGTPSGNDFTDVACGHECSVAWRADGTAVGWGDNSSGQLNGLQKLIDVKKISCGWGHIVCLNNDGSVEGFGDNFYGQLKIPLGTGITDISCGGNNTFWTKVDENGIHSLGGTGWNESGLVSDIPTFTSVNPLPIGTGAINAFVRIPTVSPENQPPEAICSGPDKGYVDWPVSFDGSASTDSDGSIVLYEWDFGDGSTDIGVSTTHTYDAEGDYTVTLTVTDNDGAKDSVSVKVEIVKVNIDGESPIDQAENVPLDTTLDCKPNISDSIFALNFLFGKDTPPPPVAIQPIDESTYTPPELLEWDTIYYWQVKVVDDELYIVYESPIWSFTTVSWVGASDPSPPDGAVNVDTDVTLSWTVNPPDVSCDVYIGADGVLYFMRNQTETTFEPSVLEPGITLEWRIDVVDAYGNTHPGSVWTFTTKMSTDDRDGDGVPDDQDAFPDDPDEWADADRDGIGDNADQNDDSDRRDTVVVGGSETGVPNKVDKRGLTIQDHINAIEAREYLNHGRYIRAVADLVVDLVLTGLITKEEAGIIYSCAAQSNIG